MVKILEKTALCCDDVLLVPQYSKIASRSDVDLSTTLGKLKLKLPLLSSNMDTVTEGDMAIAMGQAGGAGVLHRFTDEDAIFDWARKCKHAEVPVIISVGVDTSSWSWIWKIEHYLNVKPIVCVDVAHGDHERVIETIKAIRGSWNYEIIAGNVATPAGAYRLVEAGAHIIKVGIGPGSVCSTRVVSGHGMPQLSAIIEISECIKPRGAYIIADGGARYPGDLVKYLAAGADAVMLGSLLAGTDEAAGERIVEHGMAYKTFRGMASRDVQIQKRAGQTLRVEGVTAKVPYRGPVSDTLDNLEAGIRSGLSYSGANNLAELREVAEFVVVTGNTLKENHPHHPYRL